MSGDQAAPQQQHAAPSTAAGLQPEGGAATVVIVEDDQSVREMLHAVLSHEGYRVESVDRGSAVVNDREVLTTDLVILDVGLPDIDGLDVCRRLRDRGRTLPILMLTARHDVHDRVAGLDAGADDYLVKPFALEELLARVRANLRRDTTPRAARPSVVTVADLSLDTATHTASRAGQPLDLTKIEFDLLHLLLVNAPSVLTREVLHDRIWGANEMHLSNTLEVFVSQLRKKTEVGGLPRLIHTVRGVGYVIRDT